MWMNVDKFKKLKKNKKKDPISVFTRGAMNVFLLILISSKDRQVIC